MTRKQRRLALIGSALAVLGVAVALVLVALRDCIVSSTRPRKWLKRGSSPARVFVSAGSSRKARWRAGACRRASS